MDYLFKRLTECIKSSNQVVIMTHKHPDLDGMGSAVCLYEVVRSLKKECYIVFPDKQINDSLNKGINLLKENKIHINFINSKDAKKLIKDNNLLIILDTQKSELVENSELLNMKNIFVIDHHTNSSGHIKNTLVHFIDSNKSSIVEIMVEYLKYLNIKINPIILTLMLTGLEIDTHSYHLKTSEKTFICASYLTRNGASTELKNDILKISKEDILKRREYIKDSYFIKEGFALCDMKEVDDIVDLAILADELLRIDKVQVAFTVGKTKDNIVHVSARSMGKVSAEFIMSALGGGGHITDAAAVFKDKTNKEVIEMIKNIVMEV